MKSLFIACAVAVVAVTPAAAQKAQKAACTGENIGKAVSATSAMPDSPGKMAVMKELSAANTAMSKGDMRGACKSYASAQKMAASKK